MALQQGQILNNRYRIANPIGQGGFGAVYRAWDLRMNGPCVVKESFETTPETASQFEREAQILFRLKHPGLPVVYDYFDLPGQGLYLVMEFVDGQNLGDILASRKILSEAEAVDWIVQVSEALEYLHKQDPPVIHRDIKPQNIIITPAGKAVLVDFGVAKVFRAHQQTTLGARAATPGYSPPEQFLQSGTDERSDIYSLGATFYTLLTGKIPPESVARSLEEELPDIHLFNPSASKAACRVAETAMAYKKKDRFATASEFRQALTVENKKARKPFQGKPEVSAPRLSPDPLQTKKVSTTTKKEKGRHVQTWVWLAGAAFLALLIAGGFLISKGMLFGVPTGVSLVEKTLSVTPTEQAAVQPTAVMISNNTPRTYFYIDILASWKEASDYCNNLGGYLVTINSAEENEYVSRLSNGEIWLGATDELEEGTWAWVTSEQWGFTNWAQYQPDNWNNEDFLTMGSLGEFPDLWNDVYENFMPFVCEWEAEIITVTSADDNGEGTLRQAIQTARPGDIIKFSSTAFPQKDPARIMLQSGLPVINQGYLTLDASNAGVILDGSEAGGDWTPGLEINSAYNIIKGFQIINFTGPGILLSQQARHNWIGGDRSVGLGLLGEGNLISNNQDGIAIFGANNTITGNLIGTDINGTGSRGNLAAGIFLQEDANRNTIGPGNIITSSGAGEGGGGVEIRDLAMVENFITANSIHSNAGPGISYNIENLDLNDLPPPPILLFYDFNNGLVSGTTCPECHVEIFSTDSQDGKFYEGAAAADGYGNFILETGSAFTLPFLTATVYMPGRNTSEFSSPVTSQSMIQAAFDLTRNEPPLFKTSFDDGNFSIAEGRNARIEEGKLIISSEDQERTTVQIKHLRSDQYAVEFDLQARDSTEEGHCIFETGNGGSQDAAWRAISAGFNPTALSSFLWKSNYGNLAETAYEPGQNNTFTLIFIKDHIGAYLNGKFAYATVDPGGSTEYVFQQLTASNTITCEFDNYKLWDLSGMELDP